MNVIAVDDEQLSLSCLELILEQIDDITSIKSFTESADALEWCHNNCPDVAFLDIVMESDRRGIQLGEEIQQICPTCYIIFVTAYEKFALDAIRLHASGFIVKPATKEAVQKEIDYLKKFISFSRKAEKPFVQCFGNFDCFFKGTPLKFKNTKTKELLAYLVYRKGSSCSVHELSEILFEDIRNYKNKQSRLRTLLADLSKVLSENGILNIIYKTRGFVSIIPENIICDYYDYLKKGEDSEYKFQEEFMAQYSWGEDVNGLLSTSLQ